jgi:hypothetical protein
MEEVSWRPKLSKRLRFGCMAFGSMKTVTQQQQGQKTNHQGGGGGRDTHLFPGCCMTGRDEPRKIIILNTCLL